MKKRIFVILFAIILICGCILVVGKKNNLNNKINDVSQEEIVKSNDDNKEVNYNEVEVDKDKYNNVEEVTSENDYAISSDLQAMSEAATEIVEAEIKSFKYVVIDGDGWTKLDLEIQKSISGSLKKGESITLYQSGGYVPLEDHIEYYDDAFRYQDWTEDKIKNTVIKETVDGEGEPQIGTVAIYYLTKFNKDGVLNGNYGRVCGKYSELKKINDNIYKHEQMTNDSSIEKVKLTEIKEEIR